MERKNHTCLSVLDLNKAMEFWIKLLLSLKLFQINCEGKKKKQHRGTIITSSQSSTSGEVPASPIDLKSQYLHPLKLLAFSLRGKRTEFHSSAEPSQRSRFQNAVLNLKTGPDWFHTKISFDVTGWVNNDLDIHRCRGLSLWPLPGFILTLLCPTFLLVSIRPGKKTFRVEEQNASISMSVQTMWKFVVDRRWWHISAFMTKYLQEEHKQKRKDFQVPLLRLLLLNSLITRAAQGGILDLTGFN